MFEPCADLPGLYIVNDARLRQRAAREASKPFAAHAAEQQHRHNKHLSSDTAALAGSARFMAPLPITPLREHVVGIRNDGWSFAEKTDGRRVLLVVFFEMLNGRREKLVCLVDRTLRVYLVPGLRFNDQCSGLVLDAELLHAHGPASRHKPLLCVFDCYFFLGRPIVRATQQKRLHAVSVTIDHHLTTHPSDPVVLEQKRFHVVQPGDEETRLRASRIWAASQTKELFEGKPVDGIVLVKLSSAVRPGTCDAQMKIKPVHTIDLSASALPDGRTAFSCVGDSRQLERMVEVDGTYAPGIWECELSAEACAPVKPRPDKSQPNSRWVIEQTQRTVAEGVCVDDLFA